MKEDDILVTWDPFTFAILTEESGTIKYQDLKEGKTVEEEIDKVTGQKRLVVKDSDEKKQPRLEIRKDGNKVLKTYQMPIRAKLMVEDGDEVEPATSSPRSRVRPPRPRTSSAVCRVSSSFSKLAVRAKRRSCRRSTVPSNSARSQRVSANSSSPATTAPKARIRYPARYAHQRAGRATASAPANRSWTAR